MKQNKSNDINIEYYSILRDVLKNFWLMVLAAMIGFMGVYIANHFVYKPKYISTASVAVQMEAASYTAYSTYSSSKTVAGIYADVFRQSMIQKYAAEYMGRKSFDATLSTQVTGETNFITLTVTANSPEEAFLHLDAVMHVYPEITNLVYKNASLLTVSMPKVPMYPIYRISAGQRNLICLVCAMIVLILIILISNSRDTVKDENAFENKIDAKMLGSVVHERTAGRKIFFGKKKKKSLFVTSPNVSFDFSSDYQKIATKLDYMRRHNRDSIFLITSVAENEGKSTAAANLSLTLEDRGFKVLLLDMDFLHPSVQNILEVVPMGEADLGDLLSQKTRPEDFVFTRFKKTDLYLGLNRRVHSSYLDWINSDFVHEMMDTLRDVFDFIIIDTPPISAFADIASAMDLCDKGMLVVRTDRVFCADINDAVMDIKTGTGKFAGCILNDVHKRLFFFGRSGSEESGHSKKMSKDNPSYSENEADEESR